MCCSFWRACRSTGRRRRASIAPKISGLAELELGQHEQRLVITGIRTQVRHPIYLGHLCEVMGWTLGTGSLALCGLLVFAVITGAIMIRKEDAELEAALR